MIRVKVDSSRIQQWSDWELREHLLSKGLDITKEVTKYISPTDNYNAIFVGETLPDKVVGCIKTVIGLVPKTIPWEATNA